MRSITLAKWSSDIPPITRETAPTAAWSIASDLSSAGEDLTHVSGRLSQGGSLVLVGPAALIARMRAPPGVAKLRSMLGPQTVISAVSDTAQRTYVYVTGIPRGVPEAHIAPMLSEAYAVNGEKPRVMFPVSAAGIRTVIVARGEDAVLVTEFLQSPSGCFAPFGNVKKLDSVSSVAA